MSVKLVETVAVSESIPEGNEEARGVSLDEGGRSEGGAIHTLAARQIKRFSVFLFHSAVVSQPRLTELHPALPAAHYPGPIITALQQDTCYVTRMKIVTTGKKNKGSIIYKYIHTTVQKFGVSDSFLL